MIRRPVVAEVVDVWHLIEESIAAANNQLAAEGGLVSKAKTRSEIMPVAGPQSSQLVDVGDSAVRGDERGDPLRRIIDGTLINPVHSIVDGQVGFHLPTVTKECHRTIQVVVALQITRGDGGVIRRDTHGEEIGERITRLGAIENKTASGISFIEHIEAGAPGLAAEPHLVGSLGVSEGFVNQSCGVDAPEGWSESDFVKTVDGDVRRSVEGGIRDARIEAQRGKVEAV